MKAKLCGLLAGTVLLGSDYVQAKEFIVNDNAAWCWFQDERAIVHNGYLFVGSVASKLGTNGQDRSGNIEIAQVPLDLKDPARVTVLHKGLEDDDHNVPALLGLQDKRVLAVYSKHNTDRKVRYRVLSEPGQAWQPEVALSRQDKVTYANLMHLAEENDGQGRIYNFYRGINFNPTYDISDDQGKTWSKGHHFIKNKGRPYVKYVSNNRDEIHFVTTEQHPRVFDNSIYHGYIKQGNLFKSDGTLIQPLSAGPIDPTQLSKIYQGGKDNVAWTVDLHLDKNDQPYTVISVQMNDGDKNRHQGQMHGDDMRYVYARLYSATDAKQSARWQVNEIAFAGSRLYDREQDYTGLVALDPHNPNAMIISTNAHPSTGKPLISRVDNKRHWELFKGISSDFGKSWQWTAVTQDSIADNLRPVIPINHETDDQLLLWMRGRYLSYTNIDTEIVLKVNP